MIQSTPPVFITIHSTYSAVSIGLFNGDTCLDAITFDHKQACATLLPTLEKLLKNNSINLKDLSFIAVNQGPGPYTTLRITLATANGLSFATGIPLIGVDGFEAFINEVNDVRYDGTLILLNAFCREVFYALHENSNNSTTTDYLPIHELIEKIDLLKDKKFLIAGNGVTLFAQELKSVSGPQLIPVNPFKEAPALASIATIAYQKWQSNTGMHQQLLPLYLKRPTYRTIAPDPSQP